MNRLLPLILLALPLVTTAQIYKSTDESGHVIYSDKPPANAESVEKIDLGTTNTARPPPSMPRQAQPAEDAIPESTNYSINIVTPSDETSIPMGPGNFLLSVAVNPALKQGATLQLFLDGEPWGEPQANGSWALVNVFRGAHDLTVRVMNAEGKGLATSSSVRVYVHRPSTNFKNRQ